MSWRPENWETPSCEESEKWLKEAEDRLRQDRKFWGGKEAGDNGEVQSAERAVSKDRNFAKGFEAGADAMLEAMGDLREKIAIQLNWYNEPYKDWQTLSEAERALWRARADALLDLIMTDLRAGVTN